MIGKCVSPRLTSADPYTFLEGVSSQVQRRVAEAVGDVFYWRVWWMIGRLVRGQVWL